VDSWTDGVGLHLRPRGVLYFGSVPRLEPLILERLSERPEVGRLIVHLDGVGRLDVNGALALRQLLEDEQLGGLEVEIRDVPAQILPLLARVVDGRLAISGRDGAPAAEPPANRR
jgi:SulP family sulfate permease